MATAKEMMPTIKKSIINKAMCKMIMNTISSIRSSKAITEVMATMMNRKLAQSSNMLEARLTQI